MKDWMRRLMPTLMIAFWFVAVATILAVTSPATDGPATADRSNPRLPAVSVYPPGVHSAEDLAALDRPGSL